MINLNSNKAIELTNRDIKDIRTHAYRRGRLAGALITLIVLLSAFIPRIVRLEHQLQDEARATTYYYNLTK